MYRRHAQRGAQDRAVTYVSYGFCAMVLFITFYPFYYIFLQSLNDSLDAMSGGIWLFVRKFSLENYREFLSDNKWVTAMGVTALRTVSGTLISVLFTCVVAYGLSFRELKFRRAYMLIIIACMYFSGGIIPYYVVLRSLNLLNTFAVYIVPGALSLFYVLVAISFFQGISPALRESAMLDGAGEITVFHKLVLPLSRPLLATMALFIGVGHWNSWLDSTYFVTDKNLRTLGFLLMQVINKNNVSASNAMQNMGASAGVTVTGKSIQMTAMVIAVLPIICVYPFLQKHFVKGIMIGAVKG